MTTGRYPRRPAPLRSNSARRTPREENFFLVMVGCSLAIHVLAGAIFSHNPTSPIQHRPPTVYVDLVLAPVANPQRGISGVARQLSAPVVEQKKSTVPVKTVKVTNKTINVNDDDIATDIAKYIAKTKKRLDDQAIQNDINEVMNAWKKKKTAQVAPTVAPVGSATGTGDEAGGEIGAWLQKSVKAKWSWPDRKRKDLSAEVEVEFDVRGELSKCEIRKPSSDPRFDASLKRAILSIGPLPMTLHKPYNETILFNLEELQRP